MQIILACGFPKETVTTIMMFYKNTKVKVHSTDRDTDFFDIVTGVLQRGTLILYLFIICLDYILRMLIDLMKENGFTVKEARSRLYPAQIIMVADSANDITLQTNTPTQAKSLAAKSEAGSRLHWPPYEGRQNGVHVF